MIKNNTVFIFVFMTKSEHIKYWTTSSAQSWQASQHLFEKGDFVECLFFAHLCLEKILKAHWVNSNQSDIPPRIHNLRVLAQQTNLQLDAAQIIFLEQMNTFQMEGRYPDYNFKIYQAFKQPQTALILKQVENIYQWLLNSLP
ncbi:MAG: HEPN domain-containing protein [Chitinophagales bacterium]|nr:HEPN domain-containing protein [Chitinophagales bacterium]